MKKLGFLILAIVIIIGLGSCGMNSVSVADRIQEFEDDLNGSRSNIIDNFSTSCDDYNAMNISTYWSGNTSVFDDDYKTFDISIPGDPDSDFTTTYTDGTGGPYTIRFYLLDEGDTFGENWKIKTIWVDGSIEIN